MPMPGHSCRAPVVTAPASPLAFPAVLHLVLLPFALVIPVAGELSGMQKTCVSGYLTGASCTDDSVL